jgi:hypothetical protein
VFLALDLTGVFAFALNGALTAVQAVKLDIVGVVTLGMITAASRRPARPGRTGGHDGRHLLA